MKIVKRIGNIITRLNALEVRVTALEEDAIKIKPPQVTFDTQGILDISIAKIYNITAINFDTESKMEVWVI